MVFAIRGIFRGTVLQVFAFLGLLLGLWAAGWVSQWVGAHWQGARPAVVFLVLRWLVAALVGLAVASLFQWWGGLLAEAIRSSPVGWLDRIGGFVVGGALGVVFCAALILLILLTPPSWGSVRWLARSHATPTLLVGGKRACAYGDPFFPGSHWLKQRFVTAERRLGPSARPS